MIHVFIPRKTEEVKAAKIMSDALRDHDATLNHIAEADRRAMDRVDIPLRVYEDLKAENKMLHERCMQMEHILQRIKIQPAILDMIDPDTVQTYKMINPRDFTTTFRVEFEFVDTYRDGCLTKHINVNRLS